jgi:hypothetical protein
VLFAKLGGGKAPLMAGGLSSDALSRLKTLDGGGEAVAFLERLVPQFRGLTA